MIILLVIILVFCAGELLYHLKVNGEITRKFVHVLSGLLICLIPFQWSLLQTIAIGVTFIITLAIFQKNKLFLAVNGIKRESIGGVLFPLGALLAAIISWNNFFSFISAVLILTFSDTISWLVGGGLKGIAVNKKYSVSLLFSIFSFLIYLSLGMYLDLITTKFLIAIFTFSMALGIVEFNSVKGTDNFFVPLIASSLGLAIF